MGYLGIFLSQIWFKVAEKGKGDSHNGLGDKLAELESVWNLLILLKLKLFAESTVDKGKS